MMELEINLLGMILLPELSRCQVKGRDIDKAICIYRRRVSCTTTLQRNYFTNNQISYCRYIFPSTNIFYFIKAD